MAQCSLFCTEAKKSLVIGASLNVLDNNRFNLIRHEELRLQFLTEWRRLADILIGAEELLQSGVE